MEQRRHILLGTQAQCLLKKRFHKARSIACLPIYAYLLCYIYDYYVCKHFQFYVKFVKRAWNAFLLNVLFTIPLARSASMLLTQVLRSLVYVLALLSSCRKYYYFYLVRCNGCIIMSLSEKLLSYKVLSIQSSIKYIEVWTFHKSIELFRHYQDSGMDKFVVVANRRLQQLAVEALSPSFFLL